MINFVPIQMISGALEWVGFELQYEDDVFFISEGRIGRTDHPLIYTEEGVEGGWYLEEQEISLQEEDARIDLMLDTEGDDIFFLVRSDDPLETYDQRYEIITRYGWKERDGWFIVSPARSESWR